MTIKEFANTLNRREYGNEITESEIEIAKNNGWVVVFGASDDLCEVRGMINDEFGCFDGGKFALSVNVSFRDCDTGEEITFYGKNARTSTLEAIWWKDDVPWQYKLTKSNGSEISKETFNIYQDGEWYCAGIVFDVLDLDFVW